MSRIVVQRNPRPHGPVVSSQAKFVAEWIELQGLALVNPICTVSRRQGNTSRPGNSAHLIRRPKNGWLPGRIISSTSPRSSTKSQPFSGNWPEVVQRRPSRAAEILAITGPRIPSRTFPDKWLEFTSQVTELWACHADVQMDFSQSVKPADTLLENLKSLHVDFTGRSHRLMYLYLNQCSSGRK